jgi:SulP family sulfate permease
VFLGSADKFSNAFDLKDRLDTLTIDLREAHFWDITAVAEWISLCSSYAAQASRM